MAKEIPMKTLAVGRPKKLEKAEEIMSGIEKQKIDTVYLGENGFRYDDVSDKKNHGGPDRAVCVYPHEHYVQWEKEFDTGFPASAFGENITLENMTEEVVYIGNIYQLGKAVIQVTQGRIPCETIDRRMGLTGLLLRMIQTGYTGYLCRVLEEGEVKSTDTIRLIEKDSHEVTVMFGNQTYFHRPKDREAMEKILAVNALADRWKEKLRKRLEN